MAAAQPVAADRSATCTAPSPTPVPVLLMTPSPSAVPSPGDKDIEHEDCDAAEHAEHHQDLNDWGSDDRSGSSDVCVPGAAADQDHHGANRGPRGDGADGGDRGDGGSDN